MIVLELCHEFCKRGFRFLPMDLYKSDYKSFKMEGDGLRPPFIWKDLTPDL